MQIWNAFSNKYRCTTTRLVVAILPSQRISRNVYFRIQNRLTKPCFRDGKNIKRLLLNEHSKRIHFVYHASHVEMGHLKATKSWTFICIVGAVSNDRSGANSITPARISNNFRAFSERTFNPYSCLICHNDEGISDSFV